MKTKSIMKSERWSYHWIILALAILCFGSCKDDNKERTGYDPSKSMVISDFSPKEGGAYTRLLLKGENFGTDASKIKVTIGGLEAKVVNSNGTDLYCIVPNKAFEGTIHVRIVDDRGKTLTETTADTKLTYIRKMLVSTLLGTIDEKGNHEIKDGPFDDCGGLDRASWLSFDPKNPNHLYVVADHHAFRKIDFEKKYLSDMFGDGYSGMHRMRSLTWTLDKDHMIISTDRGGDGEQSNSVLSRDRGFMDVNVLTQSRSCNASAIHPVNGELYYNSFTMGQVYRYDFETNKSEQLFVIQDREWEFMIQIHPSGDYAYIVVRNQHYILRTDYDWNTKKFTTPYIVCGEPGQRNWIDGVGKNVRLNTPYQGAFVKNENYEGRDDKYDFYFCDSENHCIRILTPDARVTTFAGRGSVGVNSEAQGYIDGDLRKEARFNIPEGIVYDDVNKCFYVGDWKNHRIRKIAYEDEDEELID